ncbi:hypothetical protein Ancab_016394 [Ancistrocladus abbreviatus]
MANNVNSSSYWQMVFCTFLLLAHYDKPTHGKSLQRFTYIVHMDKTQMPNTFTSHHHWYYSTLASLKPTSSTSSNNSLKSTPSILYSYDNALHGFSATLSPRELEALRSHVAFVSAYVDRKLTVDTTRTIDFLSLNSDAGLWPASNYGRDVIVGLIDSGVWPESRSFKDDGMGPVPGRYKGTCEVGREFSSTMCNRKLIGARYFNKGVKAANPKGEISMNSARDTTGHGTHTASTVVGNYVDNVSFFGYGEGTARGVAPRARLAVYKAVWDEECYTSDVLAAMDQAISDGVDVISMSLGFDELQLYDNPVAIGSFAAMEKGVFVAFSAGNDGPKMGTLHNGIPWALTVAASTVDRQFAGTLTLGNGQSLVGWTLFPASAIVEKVPLLYNKTVSACNSSSELAKAPSYAIIVCDNIGLINDQIDQIAKSNAAAAIFISNDLKIFEVGGLSWPGIVISLKDGQSVIKYAKTNRDPWGSIQFQQTFVGSTRAPAVAFYTSRGPSPSNPGILKPDIMAPGSQVLAAYIPNSPAAWIGSGIMLSSDYVMLSGTSMACPHAAGVAALLKEAHPDWSVAAIRSAMMTTANPLDNIGKPISDNGFNSEAASPLAMGSGQVDPNRALDPGLIYDASLQDYVNLICSMNFTRSQMLAITRSNKYNCSNPSADLNYPSFIAFYSNQTRTSVQTFHRTVTNVGNGAAVYKAYVRAPKGSSVMVSPRKMVFKGKYKKQSYSLSIKYKKEDNGKVSFGWLTWVEDKGTQSVSSPIVVSPSMGNNFG